MRSRLDSFARLQRADARAERLSHGCPGPTRRLPQAPARVAPNVGGHAMSANLPDSSALGRLQTRWSPARRRFYSRWNRRHRSFLGKLLDCLNCWLSLLAGHVMFNVLATHMRCATMHLRYTGVGISTWRKAERKLPIRRTSGKAGQVGDNAVWFRLGGDTPLACCLRRDQPALDKTT